MDVVNFSTSAFTLASAEASRKPTPPHPKTTPKKREKKHQMLHFVGPRGRSQKRSLKNAFRQALREAPGRSRPASWKLKSINFPPQEAPRRRHMNFWASGPPPGRRQERFEALPAAHMMPRSSQDPSGSLGACSIHFLKLPASFFEALPLPWVALFRVRGRLRSMFRELDALILQV